MDTTGSSDEAATAAPDPAAAAPLNNQSAASADDDDDDDDDKAGTPPPLRLDLTNAYGTYDQGVISASTNVRLKDFDTIAVTWPTAPKDPAKVELASMKVQVSQTDTSLNMEDCLKLFLSKEQLTAANLWSSFALRVLVFFFLLLLLLLLLFFPVYLFFFSPCILRHHCLTRRMCPVCKEGVEASKQIELWRLPQILIVQLKRFCYNSCVCVFPLLVHALILPHATGSLTYPTGSIVTRFLRSSTFPCPTLIWGRTWVCPNQPFTISSLCQIIWEAWAAAIVSSLTS